MSRQNVAKTKIDVSDLSIRFRMSDDREWTLGETLYRLVRDYGRRPPRYFTALLGISVQVVEGEIVGVIGPNGCGKTTLLRAICGIYHPDQGGVRRHGRVSSLLSLGTGFDPNLNGIDNVRLNGLLVGMSNSEIDRCMPTILDFADIGEHVYKPMKTYSNGMISRISFAIVLAMRPDILLIDEVFSVGDLEFQRKSERALHELLSRASCQLIVTHNLEFVRQHCNRAIYMRSGQIVMDGQPDEVVSCYEREVIREDRAVLEDGSEVRAA